MNKKYKTQLQSNGFQISSYIQHSQHGFLNQEFQHLFKIRKAEKKE